jgi:hypothetical protein
MSDENGRRRDTLKPLPYHRLKSVLHLLIDPTLPSPYYPDRASRHFSRADAANRPSYSRKL